MTNRNGDSSIIGYVEQAGMLRPGRDTKSAQTIEVVRHG